MVNKESYYHGFSLCVGVIVAGQIIPKSVMYRWFAGTKQVDNEIRDQFSKDVEIAISGDPSLDSLKETPLV